MAVMVAVVVEEEGLEQVELEVHKEPKGWQQPAHPSRQLPTLEGLPKKRNLSINVTDYLHLNIDLRMTVKMSLFLPVLTAVWV